MGESEGGENNAQKESLRKSYFFYLVKKVHLANTIQLPGLFSLFSDYFCNKQ